MKMLFQTKALSLTAVSYFLPQCSKTVVLDDDKAARKGEYQPFPKRQILDSSKMKEFADDNFKRGDFDGQFSKSM